MSRRNTHVSASQVKAKRFLEGYRWNESVSGVLKAERGNTDLKVLYRNCPRSGQGLEETFFFAHLILECPTFEAEQKETLIEFTTWFENTPEVANSGVQGLSAWEAMLNR